MNKKFCLFVVLMIVSMIFFVSAQDSPTSPVGGEDVEKIQGVIEDYSPLDESGEVDIDKYKPFKSKAEERIEKINEYIGPITNVLWGVELSLSWIFIFSFIVWILLIELIVMPVSEILDFNIFGSLAAATIIASLSMQGFGKDFVVWMNSLMTQWWIGLIVLVVSVIVGVIYSLLIKTMGDKIKAEKEAAAKEQTRRDRKIIHADAEISEERSKSN